MAIKITDEGPDIALTQDEYNQLMAEYQQSYMFYSGTPPTFEHWVRMKRERRNGWTKNVTMTI